MGIVTFQCVIHNYAFVILKYVRNCTNSLQEAEFDYFYHLK